MSKKSHLKLRLLPAVDRHHDIALALFLAQLAGQLVDETRLALQ